MKKTAQKCRQLENLSTELLQYLSVCASRCCKVFTKKRCQCRLIHIKMMSYDCSMTLKIMIVLREGKKENTIFYRRRKKKTASVHLFRLNLPVNIKMMHAWTNGGDICGAEVVKGGIHSPVRMRKKCIVEKWCDAPWKSNSTAFFMRMGWKRRNRHSNPSVYTIPIQCNTREQKIEEEKTISTGQIQIRMVWTQADEDVMEKRSFSFIELRNHRRNQTYDFRMKWLQQTKLTHI